MHTFRKLPTAVPNIVRSTAEATFIEALAGPRRQALGPPPARSAAAINPSSSRRRSRLYLDPACMELPLDQLECLSLRQIARAVAMTGRDALFEPCTRP